MNSFSSKKVVLGLAVLLGIFYVSTSINSDASAPTLSNAIPEVLFYIDGISGQSAVLHHANWIDATSFSMGVSNSSKGTSRVAPVFDNVKVLKPFDKTSPQLSLHAAEGLISKIACLEVDNVADNPRPLIDVTLQQVAISSVQTTVTEGSTPSLVEVVSLSFRSICWQYTPQNLDGSLGPPVATEWDLSRGEAVHVDSCKACPKN